MNKLQYLQILGTEYTCRMRYRSTKQLGRISEFLLSEVLSKECEIERLMISFDLPQAIMSNVLSELVQQNLATIDFNRGTIKRTNAPTSDLKPFESDREVSVWQDLLTGAFLPLNETIRRLSDKKKVSQNLVYHHNENFISFLNASKNRVLSELRSQQPEVEIDFQVPGDISDWFVDELVDRKRLKPVPLYLPYIKIPVPDSETELICLIENSIPYWLVRSWTENLQRNVSSAQLGEHALTDIAIKRAEENFDLLQVQFLDCNTRSRFQSWKAAFDSRVEHIPAFSHPESRDENQFSIRSLEECISTLADYQERFIGKLKRASKEHAVLASASSTNKVSDGLTQATCIVGFSDSCDVMAQDFLSLGIAPKSVLIVGNQKDVAGEFNYYQAENQVYGSIVVLNSSTVFFYHSKSWDLQAKVLRVDSAYIAKRVIERGLAFVPTSSLATAQQIVTRLTSQTNISDERDIEGNRLVTEIENSFQAIDDRIELLRAFELEKTNVPSNEEQLDFDITKGKNTLQLDAEFSTEKMSLIELAKSTELLVESIVSGENQLDAKVSTIQYLPTTCLRDWFSFLCLDAEKSTKARTITIGVSEYPKMIKGWPNLLRQLMQKIVIRDCRFEIMIWEGIDEQQESAIRSTFDSLKRDFFNYGKLSAIVPDFVVSQTDGIPVIVFGAFNQDDFPSIAVQSSELYQAILADIHPIS